MDWRELEIFKGIDLNDSFILGWKVAQDRLVFDIELSLWPDSPHYLEPKEGEYTCYRRASLIFSSIGSLAGLAPLESASPTIDPNGEMDYGNIDTLSQSEGGFNLSGEFGTVSIHGGEVQLEVHT